MVTINAGRIIRVSATSGFPTPANGNSDFASISSDGRFVVFTSTAANLGGAGVYVRDTLLNTTVKIPDVSASNSIAFTNDGRLVAAEMIYGGGFGTPTFPGVALVNLSTGLNEANFGVRAPALSGDGRFLIYEADGSTFGVPDTNGVTDIYLTDLLSGARTLVSLNDSGQQVSGPSVDPEISDDGLWIVFTSTAAGLIAAGDTNGVGDVVLHNRLTGQNRLVSITSAGQQANALSEKANVSAEGRYVVFESDASNLVAGDTNGVRDVFLRDTVAGTTVRVSVASSGVQGTLASTGGSVTDDGRYVVFRSESDEFGGSSGSTDIFLRDVADGTTTLLSIGRFLAPGDQGAIRASITPDGRYVVFTSSSGNLVGSGASTNHIYRLSLFATSEADLLTGGDGADFIKGLAGSDVIYGQLGNDTLDGGAGADELYGGGGDDVLIVDHVGDRVIELAGGGADRVKSTISFSLAALPEIENLQLLGTANVNATGSAGANTLTGNTGANILSGGLGADKLIGGGGADSFLFDTAPAPGNVDKITDWSSDDTIRLDFDRFPDLSSGPLPAAAFKDLSLSAKDASDRILYNRATGEVFYDRDGSDTAYAPIRFVTLDKVGGVFPVLTEADFLVV